MVQSYRPCTLHQISAHVWWYVPEERTDRPSLGAVVGSERVLLLDIGASVAHTRSFLDALHVQGISSPDYAVLTHWHWDHVFGIDALTCPIIAHIETSENIARMITLDYSNDNLPNLVAQGHEVEFTREHMIIELSNTQRQNLNLRLPD
ncbi:MAG: MBL fold metallo-hydrolase, partial [Chloroflexota bacterium]